MLWSGAAVLGNTLFREVTQSLEGSEPIALVFRKPRGQRGCQHLRLQLINLLSTPAHCRRQARSPQAHQMFRDPRTHQTRKLRGQLTDREGAALGQQIEDLPARRVRQDTEE